MSHQNLEQRLLLGSGASLSDVCRAIGCTHVLRSRGPLLLVFLLPLHQRGAQNSFLCLLEDVSAGLTPLLPGLHPLIPPTHLV